PQQRDAQQRHDDEGPEHDRLVEREGVERKAAEYRSDQGFVHGICLVFEVGGTTERTARDYIVGLLELLELLDGLSPDSALTSALPPWLIVWSPAICAGLFCTGGICGAAPGAVPSGP